MQVQVPPERGDDADEISRQRQHSAGQVCDCCDGRDRKGKLAHDVDFAIDVAVSLHFGTVVFRVMPQCVCRIYRVNAVLVAECTMQQRLNDGHEVIRTKRYSQEKEGIHSKLLIVFVQAGGSAEPANVS